MDDHNLRNHEKEDKGGSEKNTCVSSLQLDSNTHAYKHTLKTVNSVNSVNSEPPACDHALKFRDPVLNSEPPVCGNGLNSEKPVLNSEKPGLNSEPSASDQALNSDIVSLLKRALIKFAWNEYNGIVPDIDEFIRRFNTKVPEYIKALGSVAVGFNANRLHMRGWK